MFTKRIVNLAGLSIFFFVTSFVSAQTILTDATGPICALTSGQCSNSTQDCMQSGTIDRKCVFNTNKTDCECKYVSGIRMKK